MMFLKVLLLIHPIWLHAFDLCHSVDNNYIAEKNHDKNITYRITVDNCSELCQDLDYMPPVERFLNIGGVDLYLKSEPSYMKLFLVFNLLNRWKKALVKFSDPYPKSCQSFNIDRDEYVTDDLQFGCILNNEVGYKKAILMQVYSDNNGHFSFKKILFSLPNYLEFRYVSLSTPRHIFSYIDFTNPAKILLKIQQLDETFKVAHYKVEVFRERESGVILLDVRVLGAKDAGETLSFAYDTYNEEGYYYFALSEIGQYCPEDACHKTFTPTVHITRKSKPTVIGIIGACYISYFFLFALFWWKYRKNLSPGVCPGDAENSEHCFVLFKPSFDQHNAVVAAVVNFVDELSSSTSRNIDVYPINIENDKDRKDFVKCCRECRSRTYVVYVNPPSSDACVCGLDFLGAERSVDGPRFAVVRLPYSKTSIPEILSNDDVFELMKDCGRFAKEFSYVTCSDYSKSRSYEALAKKIELAAVQNEACLGGAGLNVKVTVVVTNYGGEEAKEADGLIKCTCQG